MGVIELLILAVSLSMDAFAVSICKGLSVGRVCPKHMLIAGAWFGGFQALMPLVGYLLGVNFADMVNRYSHWIAFFLLAIIGGNMVIEALKGKEEDAGASMSAKSMLPLAIATSIDALAVGVMLAFLKANVVASVTVIGIVTFVISAAGVKIGSIFGTRYKAKAEIAGGIVLILLGVRTLLNGLGIL